MRFRNIIKIILLGICGVQLILWFIPGSGWFSVTLAAVSMVLFYSAHVHSKRERLAMKKVDDNVRDELK